MRPPSLLLATFSLSIVISTLLAPSTSSAQEYVRATTAGPTPNPLFWRDRLISYVIDGAGCPDLELGHARSAIIRSFNTWESEPCTDLFFSFEGYVDGIEPNHTTHVADGYNMVIWLDEWPYTDRQVANTSIIWNDRTGEILDVDIAMNAQDYYWTVSDRTVTDIEDVLVHEIGHMLGFAHTTAPEASMYDGYTEGEIDKRDLSGTDIRGLCEVYPAGEITPGQPDIGIDNLELSSGGCNCRVEGHRDQSVGWGLGLLIVGLVARMFRRRG